MVYWGQQIGAIVRLKKEKLLYRIESPWHAILIMSEIESGNCERITEEQAKEYLNKGYEWLNLEKFGNMRRF